MTAQAADDGADSRSAALHIDYYTDPLCAWSWAFEPQWRRLRFEFGPRITWRYRMGGMIPDWKRYSDPINDTGTPAQMAPHWYRIQDVSGMPVDERIWIEDPPTSSYPACIAVKAAEFQGRAAGERYLRRLREAVSVERRNIARRSVLLEVAEEAGCDPDRLRRDVDGGRATEAFRDDLREVRYRDIGRFPSLILRPRGGRAALIVGFRPYDVLLDAVRQTAPELEPLRTAVCVGPYVRYWVASRPGRWPRPVVSTMMKPPGRWTRWPGPAAWLARARRRRWCTAPHPLPDRARPPRVPPRPPEPATDFRVHAGVGSYHTAPQSLAMPSEFRAFSSAVATVAAVLLCVGCADYATGPSRTPYDEPPTEPEAVLVGAGDIATCDSDADEATAALLDSIPGTVFALGDQAYPDGTAEEYAECYHPSWGRHRARTRPTPGNHDYRTADGAPYYRYFGARAGEPGKGYYSYDLGSWHVVVLNSERDVTAGSPQERWLREDLANHPAQCTVAYWHHPRFSSGTHGGEERMGAVWRALEEAGAELVLSGHEHDYERFAPQTADGVADAARGIRQFVVGTGGMDLRRFPTVQPNSEVRLNQAYGVLKLDLYPDGYRWTFIATDGRVLDQGYDGCH